MKDKLRQQLLSELSVRNISFIAEFAQNNQTVIDLLVDFVTSHKKDVAMRAAWVLEKVIIKKREVLTNRIPDFLKVIEEIPSSGTRRVVTKILMQYEIPEDYEGVLFDFCLQMIESPKEPVAVKANCMTIAFNLLPKYPELEKEIFTIIENQIPYNSAGFRSRFAVLKKKHKKT